MASQDAARSAAVAKQLRLGLPEVIQMIKSQAEEGVVIQDVNEWPQVAWVLMQAEADGQDRSAVAEAFRVNVAQLDELISELIQAPMAEALALWDVGVLALKVSKVHGSQVLATTWDQVEAIAIEKLAEAIQHADAKSADPMKLASIAKTANSAIRRSQGEGAGKGIGQSVNERAGAALEVEMRSGELGSITLRLSPRVREQMANPNRVIDVTPNPTAGNREMLKLKEIRPIAEALDSEADKQRAKDEADRQEESKRLAAQFSSKPTAKETARASAEMFRLKDIMGIKE